MDGAGSYSVAHRAGLLPTELTGMWGWILLRSPHQRRGSAPVPAPTKQRPALHPEQVALAQPRAVVLGLDLPRDRFGVPQGKLIPLPPQGLRPEVRRAQSAP